MLLLTPALSLFCLLFLILLPDNATANQSATYDKIRHAAMEMRRDHCIICRLAISKLSEPDSLRLLEKAVEDAGGEKLLAVHRQIMNQLVRDCGAASSYIFPSF